MDSPIGQTVFFDKWYYYKDIQFNKSMVVVVEIKLIKSKRLSIGVEEYGWSVLPVFHPKGYTLSGNY